MILPLRSFWNAPALMDRLSALLSTVAVLAGLVMLGLWLANRPAFAVKRVIVDAIDQPLSHVKARQVQLALNEALVGTTLSADLAAIQRSVQTIPWVRRATVRRIWPNRLLIRVEEHQAAGIWMDGRLLVNQFGEAFAAPLLEHTEDCRLIRLAGPPGTYGQVLARARQLHEWIAPLGRPLEKLTLSAQYSWTAELAQGFVLELGRDSLATSLEERVRMFVVTQPWLDARLGADRPLSRLAYADLRYASGYAFKPIKKESIAAVAEDQNRPTQAVSLCIEQQPERFPISYFLKDTYDT